MSVYCATNGFSLIEISIATVIVMVSGAISQWPIGYLSDKFDRRKVIVAIAVGAGITSYLLAGNINFENSKFNFYALLFAYSFLCLPIFSLCISHTNDLIEKDNIVSAGAGLNFLYGLGAICGPILCTLFMNYFGSKGYFIFILITHIITVVYGLFRISVRQVEVSDNSFVAVPRATSPLAIELSPEADPMPAENKTTN